MQKITSSRVSTGSVVPRIAGPYGPTKFHRVGVALVLFAGLVGLAYWYTVSRERSMDQSRDSKDLISSAQAAIEPQPILAQTISTPIRSADLPSVLHEDLYFEVGRKGLTDEGKEILTRQAEFLKANLDWGVLVQGHTDRQGSDSYNQILGLKRAETVKQYLIGQGVAETSIKVVSLGKAGTLCADTSDHCRRMNRRVHLELRNVGAAHMSLPVPTVPIPAMEHADETTAVEPEAAWAPNVDLDSTTSTATAVEPETSETSNLTPTP